MEESQWYGTLVRDCDEKELSEAALYFEGDKLHFYCNVVTGSKIDFDIYENKDNPRVYDDTYKHFMYRWNNPNSNDDITLCLTLKEDELIVTDSHSGEEFHISCTKNKEKADEFKTKRFVNKDVVESVFRVYNGYLVGEIRKENEEVALGKIAVIGKGDEIEVYCDYLFGKNNVKGKKIKQWETKDYEKGLFKNLTSFKMPNLEFEIDTQGGGYHYISKNGYFAYLKFQKEKPNLSFYQGKQAFSHADYYLVGNTYRGTLIIDSSKSLTNAFNSTMEHEMTMTFLDEETVRYTWEVQQNWDNVYMGIFTALMGAQMNTEETHSYTISETGSIHWSDCKTSDEDFQILDHGNKLVLDFPDAGMSATLLKVN